MRHVCRSLSKRCRDIGRPSRRPAIGRNLYLRGLDDAVKYNVAAAPGLIRTEPGKVTRETGPETENYRIFLKNVGKMFAIAGRDMSL